MIRPMLTETIDGVSRAHIRVASESIILPSFPARISRVNWFAMLPVPDRLCQFLMHGDYCSPCAMSEKRLSTGPPWPLAHSFPRTSSASG